MAHKHEGHDEPGEGKGCSRFSGDLSLGLLDKDLG